MKKLFLVIILSCLFLVCDSEAKNVSKNKLYMDPTFRFLLKTQPRDDKTILRPMVPRISAKQAYNLYQANKAVLIAVGDSARKAGVVGAIPVSYNADLNSAFIQKLKKVKNKYIILFCK